MDLRIYHQNGGSLYPLDGGDASDLVMTVRDSGTRLYVDREASRVIARITLRVNRRRETAFVACDVDEWTAVFERIVARLLEIETREGENRVAEHLPAVEQPSETSPVSKNNVGEILLGPDETSDDLLWHLVTQAGRDFRYLGYDIPKWLSFRELVEERKQLSIGMSDGKGAAVLIRLLVSTWGTSVSMAVGGSVDSDSGSPTSRATLRLQVGSSTNFEPLNEATKESMVRGYDMSQSKLLDRYVEAVKNGVNGVIEVEANISQKCSDLEKLNSYVTSFKGSDGRADEPEFAIEETRAVQERIDRVVTGSGVGDVTNADLQAEGNGLDSGNQRELYDRIRSYVRERHEELTEEMRARVRERLVEPIDDLWTADGPVDSGPLGEIETLEFRYEALQSMRRRLDDRGANVEPSLPTTLKQPVETFFERLGGDLDANDHLSDDDHKWVVEEINDRLEEELDSVKTAGSDQYERELKEAVSRLETLDEGSIEANWQILDKAERLLGSNEEEPHFSSNAPAVAQLAELHRRLQETELVRSGDKQELLREQRNRLSTKRKELEQKRREAFEYRFDRHVDALGRAESGENGLRKAGEQVYKARLICSSEPKQFKQTPGPVKSFDAFIREFNRDPVLSGEDTKAEIREEVRERLREDETDLEGRRKRELQEEFDAHLKQLSARKDSAQAVLDTYDRIDKHFERPSQLDEYPQVRRVLSALNEPGDGSYELLESDTKETLRTELRQALDEARAEFRASRADNLVEQFDRAVERIVSQDASTRTAFQELWTLDKALDDPWRSKKWARKSEGDSGALAAALGAIEEVRTDLQDDHRERAERRLRDVLDPKLREARDRYRDELLAHFEEAVRGVITPVSDDPEQGPDQLEQTIQTIEPNLEKLRPIRDRLSDRPPYHGQGGHSQEEGPLEATDPTGILAAVRNSKLLTPEDRDTIEGEFRQILNGIRSEQTAIRTRLFKRPIETGTKSIVQMDSRSYEQRLDALGQLDAVLERPHQSPVIEGFTDSARKRILWAAHELPDEDRTDLQNHIRQHASDLIAEWQDEVVQETTKHVWDFYDAKSSDPKVQEKLQIKYFMENLPNPGNYEDGELELTYGRETLDEAMRTVGRFVDSSREDHTHLQREDVEDVANRIWDDLMQIWDDGDDVSEPNSTEDRLSKRSELVPSSLPSGPVIVAVVILIIMVAAVVVSTGSVPAVPSDQPVIGSGERDTSISELTVLPADGGESLQVQGWVGGDVSSVDIYLNGSSSSKGEGTIQRIEDVPVSDGRFEASLPTDGGDELTLRVQPRPNGEPRAVELPSNPSGSGTEATTIENRTASVSDLSIRTVGNGSRLSVRGTLTGDVSNVTIQTASSIGGESTNTTVTASVAGDGSFVESLPLNSSVDSSSPITITVSPEPRGQSTTIQWLLQTPVGADAGPSSGDKNASVAGSHAPATRSAT